MAYGLGLPRVQRADLPSRTSFGTVAHWYVGDEDERSRVLRAITQALEAEGQPSLYFQGPMLDLEYKRIGDAAAAVVGAALQAMPRIPFTKLTLCDDSLTPTGITSLVPALHRPWSDGGLRGLRVSDNPLGDAGMAALAKVLPPTLEMLMIDGTGCGDDGLVALAAALPALARLWDLWCQDNRAATARGWVALAGALPSAPALQEVHIAGNTGMGSEGAVALAAAVPNCPRLSHLDVDGCGLEEQAVQALEALARPHDNPAGVLHIAAESNPWDV